MAASFFEQSIYRSQNLACLSANVLCAVLGNLTSQIGNSSVYRDIAVPGLHMQSTNGLHGKDGNEGRKEGVENAQRFAEPILILGKLPCSALTASCLAGAAPEASMKKAPDRGSGAFYMVGDTWIEHVTPAV